MRLKAVGLFLSIRETERDHIMASAGKTLNELREAIDDIDDRIHDLLMSRAELAGQIRAAKQAALAQEGGDMGIAYRPAREADMLRRLQARHKGALPFESVARIWREIIASLTQLQSPYGLYICGGGDLMAFHDIGRFYYGARAQIQVMDDAAAVVQAAAEDPLGLGLVPFPASSVTHWWQDLEQRLEDGLAVIAALPFFRKSGEDGDNPSILVLSHAPFEPSGDDTSLVVLSCGSEIDDSIIQNIFAETGLSACILGRTDINCQPGTMRRLIQIQGYFPGTTELLARLRETTSHQINNLTLLGGYANPISEGISS